MASQIEASCPDESHPGATSFRYVFPFALFLGLLALFPRTGLSPAFTSPLWFVVFVPVCILCWPHSLSIRPAHWFASIALGLVVFGLWIAPDLLIPRYRDGPLFANGLWGHAHSSIPPDALRSPWVLAWRMARATLIVPVIEELFWRAWMMRWLIRTDFQRVRIGAYAPAAFWISALMFASEHGAYWDVGLVAGVIYNWWVIRTKSVADCVLMHAVTNAALSAYVIASGNWQYWQ